MQQLSGQPELGEAYRQNFRRFLYQPFYIHYRIAPPQQTVTVYAVWHTSRRSPSGKRLQS